MADEPSGGLVSGTTLCELSGLTDRRHRQLAEQGFFPPPIKGHYQLRPAIQGLFRYYRDLQQKRGDNIKEKREKKLDNENELLEIEIGKARDRLVPIEEMLARLTPACAAMRSRVLGSSMPEGERDALLDDLGQLLHDAIIRPVPASGSTTAGDAQESAAADGKPVGG